MQKLSLNLYIIGFMGSGKSFLANYLTKYLDLALMDTDAVIRKEQKAGISQIFEKNGEDYFRILEKELIERPEYASNHIIACGGGLPVYNKLMDTLLLQGCVIYLKATIESIFEQIQGDTRRPLASNLTSRKKVATLLSKREPFYQRAHITFETDRHNFETISKDIVAFYKNFKLS